MLGALIFGVAAGATGGFVALRFDDRPSPAAATPPPQAADPTPTDAMRRAIDRALPAVVTILADLPDQEVDGRILERQNIGSGIVVSGSGHVVTNWHVIAGAARVTVALSTGEQREAVFVGDASPYLDMAVIQVTPNGLRQAQFGDSASLLPGEPVAAIAGGLLTFDNAVKTGVVSASGLTWPRAGVIWEDVIQTDTAVNHGDSGGALINSSGEVIGLLTTVVRETPQGQRVEGVAIAQSSAAIRPAVESIIARGRVAYPRIGIERHPEQHLEITNAIAADRELPVNAGALIVRVAPGSSAAAAGVREGDIVVGLNGIRVDRDAPLVNLLKLLTPGQTASLLVLRDGEQLVIPVAVT